MSDTHPAGTDSIEAGPGDSLIEPTVTIYVGNYVTAIGRTAGTHRPHAASAAFPFPVAPLPPVKKD